ncbi:hypothetical protein PM082_023644 [Marasmius tenuissimus]|nr:hypothetical protein PM082_023644 [Marasmius tenuissimus]
MTGSNPAKHLLLGRAMASPKKKRSKKSQQPVKSSIQSLCLEVLQRRFDAILAPQPSALPSNSSIPGPSALPPGSDATEVDCESMAVDTEPTGSISEPYDLYEDALPPLSACAPAPLSRKDEDEARTNHWKEALKTLVDPLLEYSDRTMGVNPEEVVHVEGSLCRTGVCVVEIGEPLQDLIQRALGNLLQWYNTLVLKVERPVIQEVEDVKRTLPQLVSLVPSSLPSLAVSPAFAMLASSHLSATEAASNLPGETPSASAGLTPPSLLAPSSDHSDPSISTPTPEPASASPSAPPALTGAEPLILPLEGSCDLYLQRLCPTCFGGSRFGQSFQWGGDIHVALDGNLHHQHLKSGGDGVPFHRSTRFLLKEFVDAIGERIAAARQAPPKSQPPPIPDDVVDSD